MAVSRHDATLSDEQFAHHIRGRNSEGVDIDVFCGIDPSSG
jgi:hypothetical protein